MDDEDPTAPTQGGAIPADHAFDSAPQGAPATPAPQLAPQISQNLQGNSIPAQIGRAVGAIPTQQDPGEADIGVQGGPNAGAGTLGGGPDQQGLMDFIQGKGAAPQQELDARINAAKGAGNHSEAVIHAIASGDTPEEQGALLQAARQRYSAGMAHAGAASNAGDAKKAALFANAATPFIPDGNDLTFQPGKDGFTATVTGLGDKKAQTFKLDPAQFHQFVTGPDSKFDAMMSNPVQSALAKLGGGAPQQTTQPEGAATVGRSGEAEGPLQLDRIGGTESNGAPGRVITTKGGNTYKTAADGSLQPQTMGSAGTANPQFAGPNEDNGEGPKTVVNAMDNANPSRQTRSYGSPSKGALEEPQGAQANAERFPNQPRAQLTEAERQASVGAEQQNKIDIAKEKGAQDILKARETGMGKVNQANVYAGAKVNVERIRAIAAQQMAKTKDPNVIGGWKLLSSMATAGRPTAELNEQMAKMGVNPSQFAVPQGRTPAPQTQNEDPNAGQNEQSNTSASQVIPPEAVSKLQEGVPTTFRNQQVWTLKGGKPVQVK